MPATAEPPAPPAAAPASPAPAPPPAAAPERSPADYMAGELSDFVELDKSPQAQPGAARPRREDGRFTKAPERPVEPAPEKPAAEVEKPSGEVTPKPGEAAAPKSPMRALGEKYDGLKKEVETTYKPTIQRLESKIKELETKAASPELTEQVNQWKTRAEAAEKKLEVEAFTKSPKYQNEYEKPYNDAYFETLEQFRQLTVEEQTGEDELGQPIITTRPAAEKDLLDLGKLNLSQMDKAVKKMFGDSAPRVVQRIENLKALAGKKQKAALEADKAAADSRQQQAAESQSRIKTLASTWTEVNRSLEEKFPKAYKPEENDTEDAAAHTRGFALADMLFIGEAGLRPDQIEALPAVFRDTIKAHQPLSDAQRVQLHALTRLKIANHDRQVERGKKKDARIAQLEKDLAAYEKSEPGGRPGAREGKPSDGKDWLETARSELGAIDR